MRSLPTPRRGRYGKTMALKRRTDLETDTTTGTSGGGRPTTDPGMLRSFGQNLNLGAAEGVDFLGQVAGGIGSLASTGSLGSVSPPAPLAPGIREQTADPNALSTGSRLAATAGRGLGNAAPTLPLAALGGGIPALAGRGAVARGLGKVGLEGLSSVTGAFGAEAGEKMGGMPGAILGGIAGGMAGAGGVGALARMSPTARGTLRNARARRIVADLWRDAVDDPEEALERLRGARDGDLWGHATTSQILEPDVPRGGPVQNLEAKFAGKNAKLGARRTAIDRENVKVAQGLADSQFLGVPPEATIQRYTKQLEDLDGLVETAYAGVKRHSQDITGIPPTKIKAALALELESAGRELKDIRIDEPLMRIIEGYGDSMTFGELSRLRSRISRDMRVINKIIDPERAAEQAERYRFLTEIGSAVEDTFTEVAEQGGQEAIAALQSARRLRFLEGTIVRDPINKVFGQDMEVSRLMPNFMSFLRTARKPAESMHRLRMALGDDQEAWQGVRQMMADVVFTDKPGRGTSLDLLTTGIENEGRLSAGGAKKVIERLRQHETVFDVVYGDGAARNAMDFMRRVRMLGKAPPFTTGNLNDTADETMNAVLSVRRSLSSGRLMEAGLGMVRAITKETPQTLTDMNKMMIDTIIDPEMARPIFEDLTRGELHDWARRFSRRSSLGGVRGGGVSNQ